MKDTEQHTAKPDAPGPHVDDTPRRPPRPPIGLPILPDGRTALPKGNPCVGCDHCCRHVALEIDTPRTKLDFDNIRWYLLHKNISIMLDWDGSWMIQFDTACNWLVDGQCSHYALRPDICREYDPADCERYNPNPAERVLMRNEKDLEAFLEQREKKLAKRYAREGRAVRPSRIKARLLRNGNARARRTET
ncbi:MAG: YkgJ family cysteine cluster protein [Steroidobacteraceae bacterium]